MTGELAASAKSEWKEILKIAEASESAGKAKPQESRAALNLKDSRGKKVSPKVAQLTLLKYRLEDFVRRFPDDKRTLEAWSYLINVTPTVAKGLGNELDYETWVGHVEAVRSHPDLSREGRARVDIAWIQNQLNEAKTNGLSQKELLELMTDMESFLSDYPKDFRGYGISLVLAEFFQRRDFDRAEAALLKARKYVKGKDPNRENDVDQLLALLPYRTRPVDLKFESADGREVDFAALRGKVVIVDFWASWCPPCRADAPELVAMYQKYKDQGLTVVGVSLDESRAKMEAFANNVGMEWPHYFDGRGWRTKLSSQFSIASIPTVWIVDRDGLLVDHDARGKLEKLVPKLLAQPVAVAGR